MPALDDPGAAGGYERKETLAETVAPAGALGTGNASSTVGPVAVLDADLRLIGASREFHRAFRTETESLEMVLARLLECAPVRDGDIRTRMLGALSSWQASEVILSAQTAGLRTLVLVPAFVRDPTGDRSVLVIEDATERTGSMRLLAERLENSELMMEEMRHRMANSLQIIASVVRIKAHLVQSDDARSHLEDVHQRVLSIAELQDQLETGVEAKSGSVARYLSAVCKRLADSLIDPATGVKLQVEADDLSVRPETCISMGLVVTELVTNALKHAFSGREEGLINVVFARRGSGWQLSVADDGVGCDRRPATRTGGVGKRIVSTLAERLGARVKTSDSIPHGLTVTLIHPPQDHLVA